MAQFGTGHQNRCLITSFSAARAGLNVYRLNQGGGCEEAVVLDAEAVSKGGSETEWIIEGWVGMETDTPKPKDWILRAWTKSQYSTSRRPPSCRIWLGAVIFPADLWSNA